MATFQKSPDWLKLIEDLLAQVKDQGTDNPSIPATPESAAFLVRWTKKANRLVKQTKNIMERA